MNPFARGWLFGALCSMSAFAGGWVVAVTLAHSEAGTLQAPPQHARPAHFQRFDPGGSMTPSMSDRLQLDERPRLIAC